MGCKQTRQLLADYAVGGLRRGPRARVERHLDECPGCRAELTAYQRTGELLGQVGLESAPEWTWEAVRLRIASPVKSPLRPRGLHPMRRLVAAAALAVMVISAGVFSLWPGRHELAPQVKQVVVDQDLRRAEESHLSAAWSAPLADPAAAGLRLEEDDS